MKGAGIENALRKHGRAYERHHVLVLLIQPTELLLCQQQSIHSDMLPSSFKFAVADIACRAVQRVASSAKSAVSLFSNCSDEAFEPL